MKGADIMKHKLAAAFALLILPAGTAFPVKAESNQILVTDTDSLIAALAEARA